MQSLRVSSHGDPHLLPDRAANGFGSETKE